METFFKAVRGKKDKAWPRKIMVDMTLSLLLIIFYTGVSGAVHTGGSTQGRSDSLWKAGVARTVITPGEALWMAGYAARDRPSEGILHDLWAKALALEDAGGNRVLLVTMDLLGLPKGVSDRVRDQLETKFGLSRAQVLLNSSHTHSGPVLGDALQDIYPLDAEQAEKIRQYSRQLEDRLVALAGEALRSMNPARLYAFNGVARFQVNRRNNDAKTLHLLTDLKGPNDYAVPVIKVEDETGKIMAVAFGYACHPTVLDGYEWSGDYAGFAQIELEKMHPGATALFFQGAGADQNPLPRHSVELARQYGRTLAAAVDRALNEQMRPLSPEISTGYKEIELPLASPPTEAELSKMAEELPGYQKQWAGRMLDSLQQGKTLRTSYPYPLQAWMLGNQPVLSLGGELVIDYAIELKAVFGPELFVLGYSNDVMAYIPSARILEEGGYEGATSQRVYGLPAKWAAPIEKMILHEMIELAVQTGIPEQKETAKDK